MTWVSRVSFISTITKVVAGEIFLNSASLPLDRLRKASVSNIIIERTLKLVTVTIKSARPGVIIGKGGSEVDKLREELKKLTGKEVQINIFEIKPWENQTLEVKFSS